MIPPGADHYWGADLDLDSDDPDAVDPHPDAIFDDEHNSRMAAWRRPMTTTTRDYNGIITADTLRAWTGTDAELARHVGLTRQAVSYARLVHGMQSTVDGRRARKQGLSRTVCSAIVREASRRGCTVVEVLADLNVWAEGAEEVTSA